MEIIIAGIPKKYTKVQTLDAGMVSFWDPATGAKLVGYPQDISLSVYAAMTPEQYNRVYRHAQRWKDTIAQATRLPQSEVIKGEG